MGPVQAAAQVHGHVWIPKYSICLKVTNAGGQRDSFTIAINRVLPGSKCLFSTGWPPSADVIAIVVGAVAVGDAPEGKRYLCVAMARNVGRSTVAACCGEVRHVDHQ